MAASNYRQEALKIVFRRKSAAEDDAVRRRDQFLAEHPDYAQLEKEIAQSAVAGVRACVSGASAEEIKRCRDENLALQQRRREYLAQYGLSENYFDPQYRCSLCQDTGRVDGKLCECVRKLEKDMIYEKLNRQTPLEQFSFSSFSLDLYSDVPDENGFNARRRMGEILHYCEDYALHFTPASSNILMYGATGMGKTHLSLSIAKAVAEKGYFVLYGSAQNFLHAIEREHFGKEDADTTRELISCDLLILDDLGAEFTSAFVTASIYNIVNSRLLSGLPTIVSTNLSLSELEKRYGERVVSRFMGCYEIKQFAGRDVRVMKKVMEKKESHA